MKIKKGLEDIVIDGFVYIFLIIMAVITLLPFANVFSKSFSQEWAVVSGKVTIFPIGFQLDTMKYVVTSQQFLNSFGISVIVTGLGTILAIVITAITAYPLSKKHVPGVKVVLVIYVFTMLFHGGLIPTYLLIKAIGLRDTLWVMIIPYILNCFNMLIIKNYFESLPEEIEESARIDGASYLLIFFRIILPLSTPVLATVGLYYAVQFWNEYFGPMIYINKQTLKPLQLYLREIIMEASSGGINAGGGTNENDILNVSPENVRSATIIASTIPILLVYPYLQKYFIKGILIGSVKG